MRSIRHIVVGMEFDPTGNALSPGTRRALEVAVCLAQEEGARLDLLHSIDAERYVEDAGGNLTIVHEGVPPGGEELLQATVDRLADDRIAAQVLIRREPPALAIAREAHRHGVDVVVVGSHDDEEPRDGLGNVAAAVVRDVTCPVWTVGPESAPAPRRILAATDLTAAGGDALEAAAFLARRLHAALDVVHAYQLTLEQQMEHEIRSDHDLSPVQEHALQRVRDQVQERAAGLSPELHVGCSSPVHAILAVAQEIRPDLLVLGAVSRTGIPGLVLGSTAQKLMSRTRWSVLVVKPEGFVSPVADQI